jgi:hypothetical protein
MTSTVPRHLASLIRRTAALALAAAVATVLLAVGAPSAAAHPGHGNGPGHGAGPVRTFVGIVQVMAATAKYHDVNRALADGYIQVSGCEELPGVGAMGYHFLNPALAGDGTFDPRKPELLLYMPDDRGRMRLVAVEYFAAEAAVSSRPSVLGFPFDGPMDGHTPDMPRHYDLHLWLWKYNPAGVNQPWNPALSCAGHEEQHG